MKYFGTDGIRDRITGPLLDPDFVYRLGKAVGQWLNRRPAAAARHVVIGRDTRASGERLLIALARGLHSEGVRIFDAGICPTPATAMAIRVLDLDMGFVITASHNPATDNGIKLFGAGGRKLRLEDELAIESAIDCLVDAREDNSSTPPVRNFEARRHYLDAYRGILPSNSLMGMRIVVDCANGSTFRSTPDLLRKLGAHVFLCGAEPNGENINKSVGSEHPEVISRAVVKNAADLGIAHDGDGDRVILCDHSGKILDGDAVLAILGKGWAGRGQLTNNAVVATIMSNLGLDQCLRDSGVTVVRSGVGDRQVFYAMQENGHILGGESSGHFIAMHYLPTGDGLLAALLVLNEMIIADRPLADLGSVFVPFPQIKKNINVSSQPALESLDGLQDELDSLQQGIGKSGRILLRYSGTEPKIRLLAEAENETVANKIFADLECIVRKHLPVTE